MLNPSKIFIWGNLVKFANRIYAPTLLQSTIKKNNRIKNWAKLFVLKRGFITFHTEFLGNGQGYVPLVVNTSRSYPRSWLITGFVTRWTRRVLLVELELLTFPEHLSSPPVCSGVHVTRSLVLCVCLIYRCLFFCPFLLAIVLSVLLRFMDSHYPFGIFKLFLCKIYVTPNRICLLIVDWYSLRVTSVYNSRSQCIERIWYTMLYNKNVDIKFSAHDAFLG